MFLRPHHDIIFGGGSQTRRPTDTHAVSLYYLPGGVKVDKAEVIITYWPDEKSAQAFLDKFKDEPEMACWCDIDAAVAPVRANFAAT